jgi:copper chaperone CopZ
VQQHLGRLEGVARVDVSLAEGKVAVFAKEDSRLDPAKIFKATYDSGVSVVEMTMEATGTLERDAKNNLLFRISGNQVYLIVENDVMKTIAESPPAGKVFVRAQLFKKAGKQKLKSLGTIRLELLEVRKEQ